MSIVFINGAGLQYIELLWGKTQLYCGLAMRESLQSYNTVSFVGVCVCGGGGGGVGVVLQLWS